MLKLSLWLNLRGIWLRKTVTQVQLQKPFNCFKWNFLMPLSSPLILKSSLFLYLTITWSINTINLLLTSGVWTAEFHITGLWRKMTCFVARFPSLKSKKKNLKTVAHSFLLESIVSCVYTSPRVQRGQTSKHQIVLLIPEQFCNHTAKKYRAGFRCCMWKYA